MARPVPYLSPRLAPAPPAPAGTGRLSAIPGLIRLTLGPATNFSGLAGVARALHPPPNADSPGLLRGGWVGVSLGGRTC